MATMGVTQQMYNATVCIFCMCSSTCLLYRVLQYCNSHQCSSYSVAATLLAAPDCSSTTSVCSLGTAAL